MLGLHQEWFAVADIIVQTLRKVDCLPALDTLCAEIAGEMGFRFYGLIHHDDLRRQMASRVNLKRYPPGAVERLIDKQHYRRDPVLRGCNFAGGAFLWSDLRDIIQLDRRDLAAFEAGAREGLNQGITVPYLSFDECIGSCTFAGTDHPEVCERYLGLAQMAGIFAFQAAIRIGGERRHPRIRPKLHPRPRDCLVLVGRGMSNKQIARELSLTPRTVDGYLTQARSLFGVNDRTGLVVQAVIAGEIGLQELRRQPE